MYLHVLRGGPREEANYLQVCLCWVVKDQEGRAGDLRESMWGGEVTQLKCHFLRGPSCVSCT